MKLSQDRLDLDEKFLKGGRAALVDAYGELAQTEPEAGLYRRLGICLDESGQFEDAKGAFKRAVSLDHTDNISKRRLVTLEYKLAPKKSARKVTKKVATPVA